MANLQVTYTFVANTKARSAQVNQNFTDVVTMLSSAHHDPNIYPNASPITNSGIAANAQIRATQLLYPITLSGLINFLALDNVPVAKGGIGLSRVNSGDMIYGGPSNNFLRVPLGAANTFLGVDPTGSFPSYFAIGNPSYLSTSITACGTIAKGDILSLYVGDVIKGLNPFAPAPVQFDSNAINRYANVTMDATHAVAVYRESGSTNYFVRCALNTAGVLTYGAAVQLASTTDSITQIVSLDATHFVVMYACASGGSLRFVAGTISGTTITMGSDTTISATNQNASGYSLLALNSTTFVCGFTSGSQQGAVAGTVSGTTITLGAVTSTGTSGVFVSWIDGLVLDSSHFVFLGQTTTGIAYCVIGSVSGTTITSGSSTSVGSPGISIKFDTNNIGSLSRMGVMDGAHFYFFYNSNSMNTGNLICCSWSGTTIAAVGTNFNPGQGAISYAAMVGQFQLIAIAYNTNAVTLIGLSGTTWTTTTTLTGLTMPGYYYFGGGGLIKQSATSFFVVGDSGSTGIYGQQITLSGNTISVGTAILVYTTTGSSPFVFGVNGFADNQTVIYGTINDGELGLVCIPTNYVGVASVVATYGQTEVVATAGNMPFFSGLTEGLLYYAQLDGTVSTTVSPYRLGYALTATTINVTTPW